MPTGHKIVIAGLGNIDTGQTALFSTSTLELGSVCELH